MADSPHPDGSDRASLNGYEIEPLRPFSPTPIPHSHNIDQNAFDHEHRHENNPTDSPQQQSDSISVQPFDLVPWSPPRTIPTVNNNNHDDDGDDNWGPANPRRAANSAAANNMAFEVPHSWQIALSMVSVNAGLTPQALLHQYNRVVAMTTTTTNTTETDTIELLIDKDRGHARTRGIKSVQVHYRDGNPARIQLLTIHITDVANTTHPQLTRRIVTNTSVRHVILDASGGGRNNNEDCPLWLHTRQTFVDGDFSYQIIPCCDKWADAVDFDHPLSSEEKQVPALVDALVRAVHRQSLLLAAREAEIRALQEVRGDAPMGGGGAGAGLPVGWEVEVLAQYWWALAVVAVFLTIVAFN